MSSVPLAAKDAGLERQTQDLLDTLLDDSDKSGGRRIRCPLCSWQPRKSDRWQCHCLHVWNTFDTAGLCPGCGFQWEKTMCLRCHRFSPHKDWYEDAPAPE